MNTGYKAINDAYHLLRNQMKDKSILKQKVNDRKVELQAYEDEEREDENTLEHHNDEVPI